MKRLPLCLGLALLAPKTCWAGPLLRQVRAASPEPPALDAGPLVPEFGPTLEGLLGEHRCAHVDECAAPDAAALGAAVRSHEAAAPGRQVLVESARARFADRAARIREAGRVFGGAGSNFERFCLAAAGQVAGKETEPLERYAKLLAADSAVTATLRRTGAALQTWRDRIARETDPGLREAYALKLASEFAAASRDLGRLEWELSRAKTYLAGAEEDRGQTLERHLRFITFGLDGYVNFPDGHCQVPKAVLGARRTPHPGRGISWPFADKFSLFDDWPVLKAMLDGTGAGGTPMTVRCPQADSAAFRHDPKANTLTNEWEEYWWVCPPGSCGDLGWHRVKGTRHAKDRYRVMEYLRGRFGS